MAETSTSTNAEWRLWMDLNLLQLWRVANAKVPFTPDIQDEWTQMSEAKERIQNRVVAQHRELVQWAFSIRWDDAVTNIVVSRELNEVTSATIVEAFQGWDGEGEFTDVVKPPLEAAVLPVLDRAFRQSS